MITIMCEHVLGRLCLGGTSDLRKVERTSATSFGVRDSVIPTTLTMFKFQLRCTWFQIGNESKFAVRSSVAKFSVYFYKDVYS